MNKDITNWIKSDLNPSVFERADSVFPEHNFKKVNGVWQSKHYLNGTQHLDRVDKTIINPKYLGTISEQGGKSESFVDYIKNRDNCTFIEAVKTLSDAVGLQPPTDPNFDSKKYKEQQEGISILNKCQEYFSWCLNESDSSEAKSHLAYLQGRGYSIDLISRSDFGYIPSQDQLKNYLIKNKYSDDAINTFLKTLTSSIGKTYSLSLPYKTSGYITGFNFRIIGSEADKYRKSSGEFVSKGFYNLPSRVKGNQDVVIVESEIDAHICTLQGIENVVAIPGLSGISEQKIQGAIKNGAESFTICFDNDNGKDYSEKINKAINFILKQNINKIYIAKLPLIGEKTDPDSYIKSEGIDAFKDVIKNAQSYYKYILETTIIKYGTIEKNQGHDLTDKQQSAFKQDLIKEGSKISNRIDKYAFFKEALDNPGIQQLNIDRDALARTVEDLKLTREQEQQEKRLKQAHQKAGLLINEGKTEQATELLREASKKVVSNNNIERFKNLSIPITREQLKEEILKEQEALDTGYIIDGEQVEIPSGALSIIAAPTSHGKTTMLINMALNVAENNDKNFYFYSYEEDRKSVVMKALNTYCDYTICKSNNLKTIRNYYKTGELKHKGETITGTSKEDSLKIFQQKEDAFYKEIIDSKKLNINYVDFNLQELKESILYISKNENVGGIFIDYFQLLEDTDSNEASRQQELKSICQDLNKLAIETGLPIMLAAQYNRQAVNHLRLQLTNIGEAGDIERIVNFAIGMWNNSFKATGDKGDLNEISKNNIDEEGTIYIEILKNRAGRVGGKALLEFNGNNSKVSTVDKLNENTELREFEASRSY